MSFCFVWLPSGERVGSSSTASANLQAAPGCWVRREGGVILEVVSLPCRTQGVKSSPPLPTQMWGGLLNPLSWKLCGVGPLLLDSY